MTDPFTACRTCMKNEIELLDLFHPLLFDGDAALQPAEILGLFTAIQVSVDDGMPQKICEECLKILQILINFRGQVIRAQNAFQQISKPDVKSEIIVKDECSNDELFDNNDFLLNTDTKSDILENSKEEESFNFYAESMLTNNLVANKDNIQVKIENIGLNIYQCQICEAAFTKQRSLDTHTRKKHGNSKISDKTSELFKCDDCDKTYTLKTNLYKHIKQHSKDRKYKCQKCPKTYSRKDHLKEHISNKHENIKRNVCPYCNKAFSQLCNLKDHIRTHTGETPYLCSQCGKSFSNSSNLRQHLLRHSGLKPFSCNLCPKTFGSKGQMQSHMSTHTDAHPHRCDQCSATFTKANSLKKHKLIHLGVKPFACDTCSMRFMCKDHLKRHYRIHTGEKPYHCRVCERAFSQSNDLTKHMRVHVGQNIHQCSVCSMSFRLASELKRHYPVHYVETEARGTYGETAAAGGAPSLPLPPPLSTDLPLPEPPELKRKPDLTQAPKHDIQSISQSNAEGRITITFSSNLLNNSNGLAGDITIDITPDNGD